ncbi:MAG: hypothetical protein Q9196_007315, partial [Gyalolechia fulgens]
MEDIKYIREPKSQTRTLGLITVGDRRVQEPTEKQLPFPTLFGGIEPRPNIPHFNGSKGQNLDADPAVAEYESYDGKPDACDNELPPFRMHDVKTIREPRAPTNVKPRRTAVTKTQHSGPSSASLFGQRPSKVVHKSPGRSRDLCNPHKPRRHPSRNPPPPTRPSPDG